MKDQYLLNKGYLRIGEPSANWQYLYAKLVELFGVYVDRPELLNEDNVRFINSYFGYEIPDSFYDNPQDTKYFTSGELLIEQVVSYLKVEYRGVRDMDPETFRRVPVFKKILPEYIESEEMVVRRYKMVTEEEANEIFRQTARDLCASTRPWNGQDEDFFSELLKDGFYGWDRIQCADNAIKIALKTFDPTFARMITKKDIVKYSVWRYGEKSRLSPEPSDKAFFAFLADNASDFPMSKKQAKYYNTILKKIGRRKDAKTTNADSPYKEPTALMRQGDVVGAAKLFACNGSLLKRNLVYLLSRANGEQAKEIVDLLDADNPIVLLQSVTGVLNGVDPNNRTFRYYNNGRLVTYKEKDKEREKRRSIITEEKKEAIVRAIREKVKEYYRSLSSIGKIYVSDEFKRVAIPFNTSACGRGLDVLPTGSRTPMEGTALRLFCYWRNAFDIDVSAFFVNEDGLAEEYGWFNYAGKPFGDAALHSGDCRDRTGAEYIDVKPDKLLKMGYNYVFFSINGYEDRLNEGEIYCGYQDKKNLDTKVWSPKNIKYKIQVRGDSREYFAFAIDLAKRETVTLNQMAMSENRIADSTVLELMKYVDESYLKNYDMYSILAMRGEIVSDPRDAEIVFASNYVPAPGQKVVTPFDTEKLVALLR